MKKRFLSSVALLPVLALAFTVPAVAQQPIPGIRSTPQYQGMKSYVNKLEAKRNDPASVAQKAAFTATLGNHRSRVAAKAESLYQKRINRITKEMNAKIARQTAKIKQQRRNQVLALKNARNNRLAALQQNRNNKIDAINANYDAKANPLIKKRAKLQRKLAKATDPDKRALLKTQIQELGDQITELATAKQDKIQLVNTNYAARTQDVKDQASEKISNVRASAARQISEVKTTIERTFKDDVARAKARKAREFAAIDNLRERGAGYIEEMPPAAGGGN